MAMLTILVLMHAMAHVSSLLWSNSSYPTEGLNKSDCDIYNFDTGLYFADWDIYQRSFWPTALPQSYVTYLFYAFAQPLSDGTVTLYDQWADLQIGANSSDTDPTAFGCIGELFSIKTTNRNLKTMLSIGGWTLSVNFAAIASSSALTTEFVESAVALVKDLGFDGIDIDWEYPKDTNEAQAFTALLRAVRQGLDEISSNYAEDQPYFHLSVTVPAGPSNYQKLEIRKMDKFVDIWNFMGYDYAGTWSNVTAHSSNVYTSPTCPDCTPFNSADAIQYYVDHGATSQKVLLGMPLYGHVFEQTGGLGTVFSKPSHGSWEPGLYDNKALPLAGAVVYHDPGVVASWSYDNATQMLVSFDTNETTALKAQFVKERNLRGGMWWEASADRSIGNGSNVEAFVNALGGISALRQTLNCISYPLSKYSNIRSR